MRGGVDTTALPAVDLEASPVQGQLASAVLDLQGNLIRGQLPAQDADTLFQMLVEAGALRNMEGGFRRLTVTCSTIRYVVARDEAHVYIVQARAV
jgi:hypothetical protein